MLEVIDDLGREVVTLANDVRLVASLLPSISPRPVKSIASRSLLMTCPTAGGSLLPYALVCSLLPPLSQNTTISQLDVGSFFVGQVTIRYELLSSGL